MADKAIVLLSGGLDCVVSLALMRANYQEILALTFDYSQKPVRSEIESAKMIAKFYGINHEVISLPWLNKISTSALNRAESVPEVNESELDNEQKMIQTAKSVWVPNRNGVFISIAASYAESIGAKDIIFGANKEEGLTFKDNSKEFVIAMNNALKYSVNDETEVQTPLINMTKAEIVKKGIELNIPFKFIYSCYNNGVRHCAKCESCLRLKRALKKCGRTDIIDNIF